MGHLISHPYMSRDVSIKITKTPLGCRKYIVAQYVLPLTSELTLYVNIKAYY